MTKLHMNLTLNYFKDENPKDIEALEIVVGWAGSGFRDRYIQSKTTQVGNDP